jgi:glycosyltransferase involved in cell wall biosynthesis
LVSVVICTYNRANMLRGAVESVLAQEPAALPYEVIVVDNNSTDGTRALVTGMMDEIPRLRYVFERAQGLSHTRNAGIACARGAIVSFTDDDVRVRRDWVWQIMRVFRERPEADFVGGRILPDWPVAPPPWLTPDNWAPLALVDYGSSPLRVSSDNPICLVGANVSFRRDVFDRVGLFSPSLQRVRDGVGSCEDHELLLRLFRAGRSGWYDPRIVSSAAVQEERLEKRYHRRWHTGHGHFHALMRSEFHERSHFGHVLGVPVHMYRQAMTDVASWCRAVAGRRATAAFLAELRLRFFAAFFRTRARESLSRPWSVARELTALTRGLAAKRPGQGASVVRSP